MKTLNAKQIELENQRLNRMFAAYPELKTLEESHDHLWAYFELVRQGHITLQEALVGIIRRLCMLDEWPDKPYGDPLTVEQAAAQPKLEINEAVPSNQSFIFGAKESVTSIDHGEPESR